MLQSERGHFRKNHCLPVRAWCNFRNIAYLICKTIGILKLFRSEELKITVEQVMNPRSISTNVWKLRHKTEAHDKWVRKGWTFQWLVEMNKIRSPLTSCTKINSRLIGPNYRKKLYITFRRKYFLKNIKLGKVFSSIHITNHIFNGKAYI